MGALAQLGAAPTRPLLDLEHRRTLQLGGAALLTRSAVKAGVRASVVTTGHHPLSLLRVLRGEDVGTLFVGESGPAAPRSKL